MKKEENPGGRLDLPDKHTDENWRAVTPEKRREQLLSAGIPEEKFPVNLRTALARQGSNLRPLG